MKEMPLNIVMVARVTMRVVHGPFAGITGRLVRKRNEYYFIKTMMEVGVMLRISRWYCEPVPEKSS